MKRLALIAALSLAAAPAMAQNFTQTQLGNTQWLQGTDRNGEMFTGASNTIGNTQWHNFYGQQGQTRTCTSNRIGNSVFTNCY